MSSLMELTRWMWHSLWWGTHLEQLHIQVCVCEGGGGGRDSCKSSCCDIWDWGEWVPQLRADCGLPDRLLLL